MQEEACEKIEEFTRRKVPLDMLVIDTDWREPSDLASGCGYNVNKELFPDMKGFLSYAHERGVDVMFNDHPLPTSSANDAFDGDEIVFREKNLKAFLDMGLDVWWFDRNWGHPFDYPFQPMRKEIIGMYLYHDVTERFYSETQDKSRRNRRPMIMANVSEINNGTYLGIRESSSHRYPVQWSGDIPCTLESLKTEVENAVRCANSAVSWYSSDIGGHVGTPTRDDFIRWYQYGCLSPVLRPHSTVTSLKTREPWVYDEECFEICSAYVNMRYRLMPLIYTQAYKAYRDGTGLILPLSFAFPDDETTKGVYSAYAIGKGLVVSPVTEDTLRRYLTKKEFPCGMKARFYRGKKLGGEVLSEKTYDEINFLLTSGEKLEPELPSTHFCAVFEGKIRLLGRENLYVSSDDGVRVYIDGKLVVDDWNDHGMVENFVIETEPEKTYDCRIEYYQGENEAGLKLFTLTKRDASFYLPKRRFVEAFGGEIVEGGKVVDSARNIRETPAFVLEGAVIPLAGRVEKAKYMKLDELTLEYYPSKSQKYSDILYEDDGLTTAYKTGAFATTVYSADYDEKNGRYELKISATNVGEGYSLGFEKRKITVKLVAPNGLAIEKALVDGKSARLDAYAKDGSVYPFLSDVSSPAGECFVLTFEADVLSEHVVEFYEKKS